MDAVIKSNLIDIYVFFISTKVDPAKLPYSVQNEDFGL